MSPNHLRSTSSTSLSDLITDLDDIYHNYSHDINGNGSVDSLDSSRPVGPLPAHISSHLSSLGDTRSAPQTPTSSGLFDFNPRVNGALTSSSLNVLLDSGSGDLISEVPVNTDDGWDEKGAAVASVPSGGSYKVIKRSVKDFSFGKQLGEGSYSTVVLATDNVSSKQYAVKILDKRHIIKEKKVKYVNIEKHALNRLSNRVGIISLYFTFQDKASLYFVLDYASNGELLLLIKKHGTLSEECTRHFGAQILDAIQYMHEHGVIHRDIKPENILLDDKMRIQITDFGTAKLLEQNDQGEYPPDVRAKSFVGTAEYVSPELLDNKYCGKPGDVWAFGCIVYQMIAGKPPFRAPNEYLTFQKITKLQYAFSAGFPTVVRDLIKQIFVLQPSRRPLLSEIKKHYFFQPIDFGLLWDTPVPELGPYKMNAKLMMKIPELNKSVSQTHIKKAAPRPEKRAVSDSGKNVNPALVAAFVLNKQSEEPEERPHTLSSSSSSTRQPEYIPGTNILRPQITMRPSYTSQRATSSPKRPPKPKSKILKVDPMSPLDLAWSQYLKHADERVLKIGPVYAQRQSTETFEKKHRGNLHNAPLGLNNKIQAFNASSKQSLLSQVVNGSKSGLRQAERKGSTSSTSDDELAAIVEHHGVEVLEGQEPEEAPAPSGRLGKSLFKKFLHSDKNSDAASTALDSSQHYFLSSRACTALVTTHGRALLFHRADDRYQLITEIHLSHPFIQFKEVVGTGNRKLPTTGLFAIELTQTTFVFEVENYEVSLWTEALAKSKLNQHERDRSDLAPQLMDAPTFTRSQSTHLILGRQSPSAGQERLPKLAGSTPRAAVRPEVRSPSAPTERKSSEHKSTSLMSSKIKAAKSAGKRKPPPPIKTSATINMHTGLGRHSSDHDDDMLHAAQLAVSQSTRHPPSDNKPRSSFTKDTPVRPEPTYRVRLASPTSHSAPKITSLNSKLLARSTRKK